MVCIIEIYLPASTHSHTFHAGLFEEWHVSAAILVPAVYGNDRSHARTSVQQYRRHHSTQRINHRSYPPKTIFPHREVMYHQRIRQLTRHAFPYTAR